MKLSNVLPLNKGKAPTAGTATYTSFCLSTQSPQNGTTARSIEAVEPEEGDDDSERYSATMKAAAKALAAGSPSNAGTVAPTAGEALDLILENQNVSAAAQNGANLRIYNDKSKNILNQVQDSVYDPIKRNYPDGLPHIEKQFHINLIISILGPITDIEILSDIYHFINFERNKNVLNVHRNTLRDTVFFKNNTNSWKLLIDEIRKKAFKVLLNKLGIGDSVINNIINYGTSSEDSNNPITLPNPQKIIDTLIVYIEDKLFCEHRSNNVIRNNFHATTAVKNLRKVISVCEAQIKREKRPVFSN